jgi:hypothetical protein
MVEHVRERLGEHVAASQAGEVIAVTNTDDPVQRRASYERLAVAVGMTRGFGDLSSKRGSRLRVGSCPTNPISGPRTRHRSGSPSARASEHG